MSQFFYIHSENPQVRLINQAVEILRNGGVIVYPTDSGYALGCMIGDKHAMDRIVQIRQLPEGHSIDGIYHRHWPRTKLCLNRLCGR